MQIDYGKFKIAESPKPSGWQCEIAPGFVLHPAKGKVPNRFWRFMQRLVLGFKWEKVK